MSGEVETRSEIFVVPQNVAFVHCKDYNVAGFPLEFECLDDGQGLKRHYCKLECEDGGERQWCEEAAVGGIGPVVETLAQNRSSVDREGQRERVDGNREGKLSWPGHVAGMDHKEICAKALPRSSMVEMETASLERSGDKWSGPHPQRFKIYRWEDTVAGEVSKFVGNADGLSESV